MQARRLLYAAAAGLLSAALAGCAAPPDRDAALRTLARWEDARLADPDSLGAMIAGPDAHVRRAALRTAGRIGRSDVLPGVLAALDDPSDAVRAEAALALGFLGDASAVEPLAALVDVGPTRLRRAALFALARLPHDGAALWDVALQGEPRDAALAWNALRDRAADLDSTRLADAVRAGLVRPEADVLWRVLRCAERAQGPALAADVAAFTDHRDARVRRHACRALARLAPAGDADAVAAVLDALDGLGRLRDHEAAQVRVQALRALGALSGPLLADPEADPVPVTAALTAGARDADPHVARTALEAMAAVVAEQPLPDAAADRESLLPVWRIRLLRSARSLLAVFDEAGALDAGRSPEPAVRAAAVRAVCALRGAGLMDDAARDAVVRDPAPLVRLAATEALAAHVLPPERLLAWCETLLPEAPTRLLHAALAAVDAARARYRAEARPDSVVAAVDAMARDRFRAVLAAGPWSARADAAARLGDFPDDAVLADLIRAWDAADGPDAADIRLGVLDALGRFFPAGGAAMAPADTLRPALERLLGEGFDAPDVRQRLRARTVALDGGLLPAALVPSEASLRATLPAVRRDPRRGPVAVPFDAPRLRCTTERGAFVIALDGRRAPNTCAAVLELVAQGYYDGLTFHRVVPDFVIQGGDPEGTGWGGPGFSLRSEWSDAPFERGTVGIAHSGKDTGGSQFFVCHSAQPHLDGRYTVFGKVVEGMEIVDRVQPDDVFDLEIVTDQ